jgi:poly-gamma-glutamate capsule biosynthesis protein CapA/YwtB (metallophosphatase superfamily)
MSPGEAMLPRFTIALAGDVSLGRGVAQALDRDWTSVFAAVQPWLAGADLTFANLESPLTTAPQAHSKYDLRAPPEAVAALRVAGFDVVSLANNHALDAGEAGLRETVDTLSQAGITPLINRETGRLVDWCAGNQSTNYQSTNLPSYRLLAFDDSVAPLDVETTARAVTAAAAHGDVVVVSIHWGGEYQAAPGPRQKAVAQTLAEAGADVIVGHGPHVLQRVEWLGETLVAYSLGNFLFDQPYPGDCRQGAILHLTLRGGHVVAVKAIPTVVARGRVIPAGCEDARAILDRLSLPTINN